MKLIRLESADSDKLTRRTADGSEYQLSYGPSNPRLFGNSVFMRIIIAESNSLESFKDHWDDIWEYVKASGFNSLTIDVSHFDLRFFSSFDGYPSKYGDKISIVMGSANRHMTRITGFKETDAVFNFFSSNVPLETLEGLPKIIVNNANLDGVKIKDLTGFPKSIGRKCSIQSNTIESLNGIGKAYIYHLQISSSSKTPISCRGLGEVRSICNITIDAYHVQHVLNLMLANGLRKVELFDHLIDISDVINNSLPSKGIESVLDVQEQIIDISMDTGEHIDEAINSL